MKIKRIGGALVLAFAVLAQAATARTLDGRVFLDENKNGKADAGEAGVARVPVSDGRQVTVTDGAGNYRLELQETPVLVWVSVPRDHQAVGAFWRLALGQTREDFGLARYPQPNDFTFVQVTDTHIGRDDLFKQFAEQLSRYPMKCAFVVNTGDLVGGVDVVKPEKAQLQYDRYLGAASAFSVPLYHLPGNHEHVSINVADADKAHPLYGKGLYRRVFGPTYYSWDWAGVHFLALDGTRVPYQEKLGAEQLVWLAADLQAQPRDKPLILFCHQALFSLADSKELGALLQGRKVLGAFCGHLHKTFTAELSGFPVYMSGALSGAWWSGPNIDGTPQGFRLVQIKGEVLKTAYAGREGVCPVSIVAPVATAVRSNVMEVAVVAVDFGQDVELSGSFDGQPVELARSSREELWSVWRGRVDTRLALDGSRALRICTKMGKETGSYEIRYLIVNGREEPYVADASATLRLNVRGVDATDAILLNGVAFSAIPSDTPTETTLAFEVGKERLKRLNRVTFCAAPQGKGTDQFGVGPVTLEYKGKKIHDLRYASFERFTLGGEAGKKCDKELFFCLP
jgi:3',5'-cyclic AMP phosphodiesterase CpdA